MRLVNLAVTRPLGQYSDDRLAVELFPLNTPYGCFINRSSAVTIVAPSNCVDPVIGHFAYHVALLGGFNYLSREVGQQKPFRSYFLFDTEDVVEGLPEFMSDLRSLNSQWIVTMLAASGANEPEYPEQLHFEYGGKKGDEAWQSDIMHDPETLRRLYDALGERMDTEFGIKTNRQKYHDTSSPRNYMRHLGQSGMSANALFLRVAWSVTCWDYRRISIAAAMAETIRATLIPDEAFSLPAELKQKQTGYPKQ